MRKGISLLLAGTMLVGLMTGCTGTDKVQKETKQETTTAIEKLVVAKEGTPSYKDDAHIEIGAYAGPRILKYRMYNGAYGENKNDPESGWKGWLTEEAFKDYMDCGFTFVMPEYDALYDVKTDEDKKTRERAYDFEESDLYQYMEMAEKVNLPVVIGADFLTSLTSSANYQLNDDLKSYIKDMITTLSKYKTFKGLAFRDEPDIGYANNFKAVYNYMKSLKPDAMQFTSFLPIHTPDPTRFSTNYDGDLEKAYLEYVNAFSDAVDGFVYDSYPLVVDGTTNKTRVDDPWFQNLELVAKNASEKGYDAGITLQSCAYGTDGGENTTEHRRAIETKADAAYQVYTALAYGMKNITWFTYWQHWMDSESEVFYSAMVNYPETANGEAVKTPAYYAVQEINKEIQKFDHVFLKYNWLGTMAVTGDGKEFSTPMTYVGDYSSPRIKSVESEDEAIIGCLQDKDGYDGFMIVNTVDPGLNKSNTVTVTFEKATKAILYVKGEEQAVDLKDGAYTFNLEAGEGVFAIPVVE